MTCEIYRRTRTRCGGMGCGREPSLRPKPGLETGLSDCSVMPGCWGQLCQALGLGDASLLSLFTSKPIGLWAWLLPLPAGWEEGALCSPFGLESLGLSPKEAGDARVRVCWNSSCACVSLASGRFGVVFFFKKKTVLVWDTVHINTKSLVCWMSFYVVNSCVTTSRSSSRTFPAPSWLLRVSPSWLPHRYSPFWSIVGFYVIRMLPASVCSTMRFTDDFAYIFSHFLLLRARPL